MQKTTFLGLCALIFGCFLTHMAISMIHDECSANKKIAYTKN